MKKIIVVVCAITVTTLSFGQAPKKTTKIFVKDTLTREQNYVLVMQRLIEEGYEIEKTEREFGLITTAISDIRGINGVYYLYFAAKDKEITVRGKLKVNVSLDFGAASTTPEFSQIENTGMKGSADRICFEVMHNFARSLGTNLLYEIKATK